ncbi:unnamed protein product [Mytilus edulis]|uniref:B box-type domain-containing protein n=1 Tax=Mytilus edulis TaxID=6550 RepID=A0A8S3V6M5_MYTED|nr:unnamed protein product [Mytilus edulis]
MASSKSLQEGQIPISCQLCEDSNEIKWKCIQCDFLLCTKCKKLHERVKSTYQHTIIDTKDIASHLQQAKDNKVFRNIPCEIHSGHNCCLFCQTCDKVVCPSCIAETHTKHDMIELSEGYKLTVKKIKTFNSELDVKRSNCQKGLSDLSLFKSSENFKYMSAKQSIESREKVLKDEVEMHTKTIMKEIDQRWDRQTYSVDDAYMKSQKIDKDLEFRSESLTNALASVNTRDVFNAYKEEKTARIQKIEPVKTHFKRLPQYVPGKMQILQSLHGNLTESDDIYSLEQYKFNVISKFNTGFKQVDMVFICADGTMWISDFTNENLQKLPNSNGLVKVVQNRQVKCVGMALLQSGELLISTKEPNLKILFSCYWKNYVFNI